MMRLSPRGFRRDERGASALEFALVTPLFLIVFFGVVETGQAVLASRRTEHASSAVSDLVAQNGAITRAGVQDCFAAAAQLMSPLPTARLGMKVTSVTLQSNGKATVDWSEPYNGMAADTAGAVYTPPAGMLTNTGDSVIISTANYTLVQASKWVLKNDIAYTRTSYAKPRNGSQVTETT